MKKTIAAYSATAILLGFAIMMVPLALKTGPPTYQPEIQPAFSNLLTEDGDMKGSFAIVSQPSNLLPSSLILFSGLMIALVVYGIFKRRAI